MGQQDEESQNQSHAKYLQNFSWSELDDLDGEQNILLNEFEKDKDLEENMITNADRDERQIRLSADDKAKAPR